MNRIKYFEAKRGQKFDKNVRKALYQLSEEFFMDNLSDSDNSDESELDNSENGDTGAEIQHILAENRLEHVTSSTKNLDF